MRTKREILVRNLRLDEMADDLPDTVFPIQVTVQMDRATARDGYVQNTSGRPMSYPDYPVDVKQAVGSPYIPHKVVWFMNPVEHPNQGEKAWPFATFAKRLAEIEDRVEAADPSGPERLYLSALRLVEVPREFLDYAPDGSVAGVKQEIYAERQRVAIATFDKRSKIMDEEVREQLGDSLPGRVIKPMRLTNLKEVSLKQYRGTASTTATTTRRMYFSDGQAKQYSDTLLAPKEWDNPIWSQMEEFFPELATSDFVDEIEFEGRVTEEEHFIEERARVITTKTVT